MTQHFHSMVQSQRGLADAFADLGMKSPELQDEFNYNAESQRSLVKNGEVLLGALNFFTSNLTTLVHKTMEDSIMTVKAYESARIEYDAYRTDLESTQTGPRTAATAAKAEEAKQQFDAQKEKFDRLRGDLAIKLRFLEENKVYRIIIFHYHLSIMFKLTILLKHVKFLFYGASSIISMIVLESRWNHVLLEVLLVICSSNSSEVHFF